MADVKISHRGISPQYTSRVRVWVWVRVFERIRVFGRVSVFGGLGLREGLGFFDRVGASVSFLTFAIVKLLKYGKTCAVLEGSLCYKFVTIWKTINFFPYS